MEKYWQLGHDTQATTTDDTNQKLVNVLTIKQRNIFAGEYTENKMPFNTQLHTAYQLNSANQSVTSLCTIQSQYVIIMVRFLSEDG